MHQVDLEVATFGRRDRQTEELQVEESKFVGKLDSVPSYEQLSYYLEGRFWCYFESAEGHENVEVKAVAGVVAEGYFGFDWESAKNYSQWVEPVFAHMDSEISGHQVEHEPHENMQDISTKYRRYPEQ